MVEKGIRKGYFPHMKEGRRYYLAIETAFLVRETRDQEEIRGVTYLHKRYREATDKRKWREKLQNDPVLRKRVLEGKIAKYERIRATQRETMRRLRKQRKGLKEPKASVKKVYGLDPWTREKLVITYPDEYEK